MLRFNLSDRPAGPLEAELRSPDREVWRDVDGTPCAFGDQHEGRVRIYVPEVGLCNIDCDTRTAVLSACPNATPILLQDTLYRTMLPLALPALGYEAVHASGVMTQRGVVALAAVSGTGKTTLACALAHQGASLWADDAVVLDLSSGAPRTLALPFRSRLLPDAAARFHSAPVQGCEPESGFLSLDTSAPLAAILLLQRTPEAAEAWLEPLAPLQALRELLPHAYAFTLEDAPRKRRMLEQYTALVQGLPIYRAYIPEGLERLGTAARRILSLLE